MGKENKNRNLNRRQFIKDGASIGVGASALAGLGAEEAEARPQTQVQWDRVADVVVVGAGASGLPAAIMARDGGASVIVIEANHDIGGHAMLSGGRIPLGGGTSMQRKYGIDDTPDQVYLDHTDHRNTEFRFGDRDLVRMWADENVPTFEFLLENGVQFEDVPPGVVYNGAAPRLARAQVFSADLNETINGRPGSGVVRPLEKSARAKDVEILLGHNMTRIIRENPTSGRVLGIAARFEESEVTIQARRGVILCTGGHTSNVEFRRIFDPRLTEEYQVAGEPYSKQTGDSETMAIAAGAALWGTAIQHNEEGSAITKTRHIGCQWGYPNLKWDPGSPMFAAARASGLTVGDYQDLILVNQVGCRFWNELDNSYAFLSACLGTNGNLGKDGKANGGGPIWAIFDANSVIREEWDPSPPNVDPNGWFFSADTIGELAGEIRNPYQRRPIEPDALEATVARYNAFVDSGSDEDFAKPTPTHKIQTPPFYAAWSTPILHDSLTGLKINTRCQVIDTDDQIMPGLYAAGESAGGFGLHGLPRVIVFGRIAGREAASG
jgi:urocanate reductase